MNSPDIKKLKEQRNSLYFALKLIFITQISLDVYQLELDLIEKGVDLLKYVKLYRKSNIPCTFISRNRMFPFTTVRHLSFQKDLPC